MFDFIGKGPDKSSLHSDDCRIFKVDPTVKIQWWRSDEACGRRSAYAGPSATTSRLPTPLFPWTRTGTGSGARNGER